MLSLDFFRSACVLAVLAATAAAQEQVRWQPNLETAQRVAAQSNRLVLIHCWAPWCKPCVAMDHDVFGSADAARALDANFVPFKLNVDEAPATARMYGVSSLPTDVIITPTGRLVAQVQSPPTAAQYVAQMNQLAEGHRHLQQNQYAQHQPGQGPPAQQVATAPGAGMPGVPVQTVSTMTAPPTVAAGGYGAPAGAAPVAQVNTAVAAAPAVDAQPSDDRYADYYRSRQGSAAPAQEVAPQGRSPYGEVTAPQASNLPQQPAAPVAAPPYGVYPPQVAPQQQVVQQQPQVQSPPPVVQPPVAQYAPITPQVPAGQPAAPPVVSTPPSGNPALCMDGYCPVTLSEQKRWAKGNPAFGAIHRGRTYLFVGQVEQQKFLASPDTFSPVVSGNDPVLALDEGQAVPGRREHGVFFDKQIYLFSTEASLQRFNQNPQRYATQVLQAMRDTNKVRQ